MIETTMLAVLQGIAEFLPISSSGHLVLGKSLLGLGDVGIRLDIFLHVGTLVSIALFYRGVLVRLVRQAEWSYLVKIVISAIPAGIVGVLFKDQLETLFASPRMVGGALIFTGLVLTATKLLPLGTRSVSCGRAFLMGVAQAIAILPGVSRSGMTLAAARAAKVDAEKSAEFSFLMSAPPIAGAALLEVVKACREGASAGAAELSWPMAIYGAVVAAVVGYFALEFLLKSLKSSWFWLFGPYCLIAGVMALICC